MYDSTLLIDRMAELGLNFQRVAKHTGLHPSTVKNVMTTGRGQPESIKAIAKVLKFTLPQIVKRRQSA